MTPHILAVGYLTTRVVADDPVQPKNTEAIVLPHVLPISHFVPNTFTIHATRSKYLIRTSPEATAANRDLVAMLSESLSGKCDQQRRFGVIPLMKDNLFGLLKATAREDHFILQVVAIIPTTAAPAAGQQHQQQQQQQQQPQRSRRSSIPYTPSHLSEEWQQLSLKKMPAMPLEVMQLCQQVNDPACYQKLQYITKQVHHIANVYDYWDLWAVLVGICDRFQINVQHILNS